jgi:hypothetical protein
VTTETRARRAERDARWDAGEETIVTDAVFAARDRLLEAYETEGIDPRVIAILARLNEKVAEATRETLVAFAELAAVDPTLELPRRRVRPAGSDR